MGRALLKLAWSLVVTIIVLALILGLNVLGELWLAMVIGLESIVGTTAAGVVGVVLVTPLTFVLMHGLKDPRTP